jgi:hypothetical protein
MSRAFIYGPRMCGMAHAGQFEPSPRTPPPPYPAAPYANLRTPGGSGRVPIVTLRGVFAPLPRPLGISLSTLRAIRNLTQLPQNNRDHQMLIDSLSGVLAPAPGERERRHPGPGKPARFAPRVWRFAPPVLSRRKPPPANRTCAQRPGSRGRTIQKKGTACGR